MKNHLTKRQRNRITIGHGERMKTGRIRNEIHAAFKRIAGEERRNVDAAILRTHVHIFR